MLAAFNGRQPRGDHPLYWDFSGNHAVRAGDWKLVAERGQDWELYDLSQDRSETHNLAGENPEQVTKLAGMYDAWAKRTGARSHAAAQALQPSKQSQRFDLKTVLARQTKED